MTTLNNIKTETFLPIFTGFYSNNLWETENQEQNELDSINEERENKGFAPIEWDSMNFDYEAYNNELAEKITVTVGELLEDYICSIEFQKIVSPKYYNFSNDSINCIIEPNTNAINEYLTANNEAFKAYLRENYTSCSGFISSHSNELKDWINYENDSHKLGAVLNFIAQNEGIEELDVYYNSCEDLYLSCENYHELIENEEIN